MPKLSSSNVKLGNDTMVPSTKPLIFNIQGRKGICKWYLGDPVKKVSRKGIKKQLYLCDCQGFQIKEAPRNPKKSFNN